MTIIIAVGDLHANSKVAICPPVINLDDGGTYHASRGQRWLWECWINMWDSIKADYPDQRKVLVLNGDLGELDTKRRSYQLVSGNKATILEITRRVLEPAVDLADAVYVIRGTAAHVGKSAWLEEEIAQDLDNAVSDGANSWWHIRAKVENVRFDIAHHATMGSMPWTERNAANRIASIMTVRYWQRGQQPPDIALRSHNHRWSDSGKNFPTYALCLPCWSLATEYLYRTGKENDIADIGGVVFEIDGKDWTERRFDYKPKEARRVWALVM